MNDLVKVTRALHLAGGGNLRVMMAHGTTVTFTARLSGARAGDRHHRYRDRPVLLMIGIGLGPQALTDGQGHKL